MAASLSDRAVIAGIGQTEFSKNSGRSELQLAVEASLAALADAGLTPADVDGMVTYTLDSTGEIELIRNLGIPELRFYSRAPYGGAATCAVVLHAASAVASGAANVVLIYRAFNERSGRRFGQPMAPGQSSPNGSAWWRWYTPFGLDTPAKWASLHFQRYMHVYGVTNEDFGRYSVVCRKHAANNPNAYFYERPITLEDHQNSRWIVEPVLRLLDCCQESDGGVAMVITSRERARDLRQPPARIVAAAQSMLFKGDIVSDYYHGDIAGMPEIGAIGRQLWDDSACAPRTSRRRCFTITSVPSFSCIWKSLAFAVAARPGILSPRAISNWAEACPSTPMEGCWEKPISMALTTSTKRCANCAAPPSTRFKAPNIFWSAPE